MITVIDDTEETFERDGELVTRRTRVTESRISHERAVRIRTESLAKAAALQTQLTAALEACAKADELVALIAPVEEPRLTDEEQPVVSPPPADGE